MSEPTAPTGRGMQLHTKILLGLLVGAALGVLANFTIGPEHGAVIWANTYLARPIGQIFLRLLFMVVVPLVFASITVGVAGLGDIRKVGRVGGKALAIFFLTAVTASTIGLVAVNAVRPGERLEAATRADLLERYSSAATSTAEVSARQEFGIQTLVNLVPRNPVRSAADLDLLGLIFFAIVFGAALTLIPTERATPVMRFLEGVNDVVIKMVGFAMKLAPFGVAALIFGVTSEFGFDLLAPLASYVLVVLVCLVLHGFGVFSIILRLAVGISPLLFFSRIRSAMVTAFSTSSSSATLPTNLAVTQKNLGVPESVSGFVLPLGATMNMNGTALFEGVTILFLAQVFGVDLNIGEQIVVVIMSVLTAIGAAGVPGGSIPLLVGIMAMFDVPAAGIAIVLGVDRILDMSRTTVNVMGDAVATLWVAKTEGVWSPASIPPASETIEAQSGTDESPGNPPLAGAR
jgi:dicarboxylate/amino acid:cation (Na+ or H+) symporter, DAACS family